MKNNVFLDFDVGDLMLSQISVRRIPSGNRHFMFARFKFSASWSGLSKIAVFLKAGVTTVHAPIVDGLVQIPNEFMAEPGGILVSVYAGDRRTVNSASIQVIKSGYVEGSPPGPPEPSSAYVQTEGGTVPFIRFSGGQFEVFAEGKWRRVSGGDGDVDLPDDAATKAYVDTAIKSAIEKHGLEPNAHPNLIVDGGKIN